MNSYNNIFDFCFSNLLNEKTHDNGSVLISFSIHIICIDKCNMKRDNITLYLKFTLLNIQYTYIIIH